MQRLDVLGRRLPVSHLTVGQEALATGAQSGPMIPTRLGSLTWLSMDQIEHQQSGVLDHMSDRLAKFLFGFGLIFVGLAYGYFAANQRVFPHELLRDAWIAYGNLREHWRNDFGIEPTRQLEQARHEGAGVTVREAERIAPGLTLISGFFDEMVAVRLLAPDGAVLNHWPVRFTELWADRRILIDDEPATDWNVFLHGSLALPDGSIIVNFDTGKSLVRLDRCGEVIWKSREPYHHSFSMASNGRLWALLDDDQITELNPYSGERLQTISVQRVFEQNDAIGSYYVLEPGLAKNHPNDIEPLPPAIADAFPLFEPGDLMYSMRDINGIVVFDPRTLEIRWMQHGPWLRQHDPDFLPDGRISIYDNRMGRGASRILAIDPVSRQVETLYEGSDDEPFYSVIRGLHQHLPNGNILITEAQAGRAFEVTRSGEIVWEFINRYDVDRVAVISNAVRYPPGYFEVDSWGCPD